jgi:hypothetical protein
MKKNVSRKLSCYDRGTFMDGSPYPFFVASKKFQLQPEHFYKPKYFVFIPHLLANMSIWCPQCLSRSEKGKNGQPICLTPNGFPKAPRRVVDLDENIYIIRPYRYKCQNCRKTYQSWSPALLNVLPRSNSRTISLFFFFFFLISRFILCSKYLVIVLMLRK